MYGMVLMMTLSGGADVAAWQEASARPAVQLVNAHQLNRHRRGGGCYGGGCYGGGCWGGGCYGGGCWGGYSHGCWGGGCWGGSPYAPAAPAKMPPPRRSGYYGEVGENPPTQMPRPGGGDYRRDDRNQPDRDRRAPGGDTERPRSNPPQDRNQSNGPPDEARSAVPATIVVTLPPDATLRIDDTPTRSTNSVRVFVSPPLTPGKTFYYTLRAEVMRNGQSVKTTQQIDVRAGQVTRVELNLPERVARR